MATVLGRVDRPLPGVADAVECVLQVQWADGRTEQVTLTTATTFTAPVLSDNGLFAKRNGVWVDRWIETGQGWAEADDLDTITGDVDLDAFVAEMLAQAEAAR